MKNKTAHFPLAALAVSASLIGLSFAGHEKEGTTEFWSYPSSEVAPAANAQAAALTPGDIDLAICLDTSGSMDGLIESAKQRLWALVNDLAKAEPAPKLRVALLTYGSPEYGADNGWVKTILPLTTDLDMVSMQLFALQTSGGDEYVARVADAATKQLRWSAEPGALKMVVVAGNESAEQDPILTLKQSVGGAADQGIIVHSLYCRQGSAPQNFASRVAPVQTGTPAQGIAAQGQTSINNLVVNAVGPVAASTPPAVVPLDEIARGWKKVADLAGGAFAVINQDSGIIVMETPFDADLVQLSTDINTTYIAYGENSSWGASNQVAQDTNAAGMNFENAASRAMTKGGKLYMCSWDLIDSLGTGQLELAKIDKNLLAEEYRSLSPEDLSKLVEKKRAERSGIQAKIEALGKQREAFLAKKRAELSVDESEAFDSVLRAAFRKQAAAKGFKFPAPAKAVMLEVEPVETVPAEVIFDVTLGDVLEGC